MSKIWREFNYTFCHNCVNIKTFPFTSILISDCQKIESKCKILAKFWNDFCTHAKFNYIPYIVNNPWVQNSFQNFARVQILSNCLKIDGEGNNLWNAKLYNSHAILIIFLHFGRIKLELNILLRAIHSKLPQFCTPQYSPHLAVWALSTVRRA